MAKLSCPYCYRSIRRSELWFLCTGRGEPGRPSCVPKEDPVRTQETGWSEPSRPAFPPLNPLLDRRQAKCPHDGSLSRIRTCPHCHTPLPQNFGSARNPLIAMVGAKGTGKTVYLTVLTQELRGPLRRRFDAAVRFVGDTHSGSESPVRWILANMDQLFNHRAIGPLTPLAEDGRREPLVIEWRRKARRFWGKPRYRTSFLSFYDTAGEDLTSLQRARDLRYLGSADALILLLDPFMLPEVQSRLSLPPSAVMSTESTHDVVSRVTEQLQESKGVKDDGLIDIPVAVAFAKMDAFFDQFDSDDPLLTTPDPGAAYDEEHGQTTHEHVRSLLHELGGDDIDMHLENYYGNYRYFAVSALGAPPDYATATVSSGGVRPHRVDEPLVWLLSHFGVVPRRGAE
jgi:hypothetical protein